MANHLETQARGLKSFLKTLSDVVLNQGILVGFFLLIVFLTLTNPVFLSPGNLLNVTRQVSVNAIAAFGATFVIISGGIDLSSGAMMGLASITVAKFMVAGLGVVESVILVLILGGVVGLINGVVTHYGRVPAFVTTLGMTGIARGAALTVSKGYPITGIPTVFRNLANAYIGPIPVPAIIMAVIFVVTHVMLEKTKFGREVIAIGGNAEAARLSGVNTRRVGTSVFVLAGVLAAFSGIILTSRFSSGQAMAGDGAELDVIAAVVLGGTSLMGGRGSVGKTLVGALLIGVLNNGLNIMAVAGYYQRIVKGAVIIAAIFLDMLKERKNR